jgi:hypothetical protein
VGRFVQCSALPLLLLVPLAACNRATFRWQPSLVSQVPDSTPVRFYLGRHDPVTSGRALGWQRRSPRVVTARGDTVVVPPGAMLDVRLNRKAGHPVAGAIIGGIIGVGIEYANCPEPKTYCGEEDPTELLVAGLGAIIGNLIKTDHWIRVRWDLQ